jgi:hypothetical protein
VSFEPGEWRAFLHMDVNSQEQVCPNTGRKQLLKNALAWAEFHALNLCSMTKILEAVGTSSDHTEGSRYFSGKYYLFATPALHFLTSGLSVQ